MVDATLRQLDDWYNEASAQMGDRPQLLSKLALLELCGWIEGEFDRLILRTENGRLRDRIWLERTVVGRTFGFSYANHLRRMFCNVFGELFVQRIEDEMEAQYPGELERLKNILGELWIRRCSFAHDDFAANVAAQRTFDAPSWCMGQLNTVRQLIAKFDAAATRVVRNV